MADYVNERPVCVSCHGSNKQSKDVRHIRGLLLSFGLLCILQATLNVSLRFFHYNGQDQCAFNHSLCDLIDQQDKSKCPQGWTYFLERCFLVETTNRNWTEAEYYCTSVGGNLASVHSSEEYSFIQTLIRAKSGQANIQTWIGGHDAVKEGMWFWSDGTQFDFVLWAQTGTQPDNRENNEHCLEVNYEEEKLWNDEPCDKGAPSVCVRRLGPV